jgi:hypothetical protein
MPCAISPEIEAHHDDRIGALELRFGDHAVDGVLARRLQHLGVLMDLAADDGLEPRQHVADEAAAAHGDAEDSPSVSRTSWPATRSVVAISMPI